MINQGRVLELFLSLVRIDSESGDEAAVAQVVADYLGRMGVLGEIDGAGNVVATLPGRSVDAPPVMFCAHLDTVKPGKGVVPEVADGIVTSASDTVLGADNKAAVAALLEVVHSLRAEKAHHGPVELVFTTGEEAFCLGASALDFSRFRSRIGYAFDSPAPVGNVVATGPGHARIDVDFIGRAAHTGIEAAAGVSAIRAAAAAVTRMDLGVLAERTTANVGTIEGGTGPNVVPERCCLSAEARSCEAADVEAAVRNIVTACEDAAREQGAECEITVTHTLAPFHHDPDAPVVDLARRAARRVELPDDVTWTLVGSDVNILNQHDIAAVNLGAALTHSHTDRETHRVRDLVAIGRHAEAIILEAAAS